MNVVKWKYRVVKPGQKGHTIDNYIDYVERQVDDRKNGTGPFLNSDKENIIGTPEHDKPKNNENYDAGIYSDYMGERKGSRGLFSSPNVNTNELVKNLKEHEGAVWIPIVSLKEKDALEMKLNTEEKWMEKAQELAESYRKELGIPKENFNWVAAFHTKAEDAQNPKADAGCQPHLHFILWETEPSITRYSLSQNKIDEIRSHTSNILSRDYMRNFYDERNQLRETTVRKSLDYITQYAIDVKNLLTDINEVAGRKGRLNVDELEKRENIANKIADTLASHKELDKKETYYMSKLGISDEKDARRVARNYHFINEELDNIATGICQNKDINRILENWNDISIEMRKGYDKDMAISQTNQDFDEIKNRIKNGILNECKNSMYDNTAISPRFRGLMMEKLHDGYFKKYTPADQIEDTIRVVSQLCKTIGMSQNQTEMSVAELLARSQKEEYEEEMRKIVEATYLNKKYNLAVTSQDFKDAMKSLGMPVTRQQAYWKDIKFNSYQLVDSTVLKPLADEFALVHREEGNPLKAAYIENNLSSLISDATGDPITARFAEIIARPLANNFESYQDVYNNLLDAYSELNQRIVSKDYVDELEDELQRVK